MKKQLFLLLKILLIVLVLAGCGNNTETSNEFSKPQVTGSNQITTEQAEPEQEYRYNEYLINPYIARTLKPDKLLYERLFDMVENVEEQTDLSDLSFEQDVFDHTVSAIMDRLEFPYVKSITLINGKTGIASYSMDKDSAIASKDKFRANVENILSTIVSPLQSETRNALALYNYLCKNVSYATNDQGTSGYDALVNGTAICYGYSYTLVYLLDQIGIEGHITSSTDESHMWVIAKLDGVYRHLDPTNGLGTFGLSDEARKRDYNNWYSGNMNYSRETSLPCTDKTYDFLLDSYSIDYNTETGIIRYTDESNIEKEFAVP